MKFKNSDFNIFEFLSNRTKIIVPVLMCAFAVPSLTYTSKLLNPVVSVVIDGQYIGVVNDKNEFENYILSVEQEASQILQSEYSLDLEKEYKITIPTKDQEQVSKEEATSMLSSKITEISTIAVIRVDGNILGATKTENEANQVLQNVLVEVAGQENIEDASFVQDVEVSNEFASIGLLKTSDELVTILTSNEMAPSVHTVNKNETLSQIAQNYGMKTDEIVTLNPDIEPTKMQIGQSLIIEKAKPAISVEVIKEEVFSEQISYSTEKLPDDSMTTSQVKTITQGEPGERKVTAQVTYIDGVEVAREVLSSEVIKEPVTQVQYVGTKQPVSTGKFAMPVSGTLSSKYGYRSSGFHTGIDIATSYGKAISASDGGTVTFAGWNGGYGYCVIISHGNGFETLYAHASKLTVSVGQKVSKGDKIAEIGSTGNSTGNHLHFEIRVNGNHQNPYNYL